MYCKNCGAENEDSMRFCVSCGMEISADDMDVSDKSMSETAQKTIPHKMSKKTKCVILIIAVILLLIAVIYKICGGLMSPERLVTKYINAQAAGKYSELYEMLDMPDGEFTVKSQFIDTLERSSDEMGNVTNITVTEASATDLSNTSKYYFTKAYDKAYRVTYNLQDDKQEQKTVFLSMQKGMLFDKYKIMPTEYLTEKYEIYAPSYTEVSFDNIKLGDTYNSTTGDNTSKQCYLLNNIFLGKHNVTVTAPFIENTDIEVDVNKSKSVDCLNSLVIKQEIKDKMQQTAEDTLKVIFDAAAAKKDFSEVASQLKINSEQMDKVEKGYTAFSNISWSGFNSGTITYDRLELTNIEPEEESSYSLSSSLDAPLSYIVKYKVTSDVSPTQGYILFGDKHKEEIHSICIDFSCKDNDLSICGINNY